MYPRLDDLCYDNTNPQVDTRGGERPESMQKIPRPPPLNMCGRGSLNITGSSCMINDHLTGRMLMSKDFLGWEEWQIKCTEMWKKGWLILLSRTKGRIRQLSRSRDQIYPDPVPTFFHFSVCLQVFNKFSC